MSSIKINDFSAGWCPSDNAFNGRKNCLLQMDNMELDENGALGIVGGKTQYGNGIPYDGTDLFCSIENWVRIDYIATVVGNIYRNGVLLFVGGATDKTAFGVAYDYTLICSGAARKKVNQDGSVVNLGITTPSNPVTLAPTYYKTAPLGGSFNLNAGKGAAINNGGLAEITPSTAHTVAGEWIGYGQTDNTYGVKNMLTMTENTFGVKTISGTSDDLFLVTLSSATLGSIAKIFNVHIYFMTDSGQAATANPVDNYYDLFFESADIAQGSYSNPTPTTEQVQMWWGRGVFTRLGGSADDWSTIRGFAIQVISSDPTIVIDFAVAGGVITGNVYPTYQFIGGTQTEDTTYLQVNVNTNNGTYLGKSPTGPQVTYQQNDRPYSAIVTPYITALETQVDQIWIFRSNQNLNGFYRVAVLTSSNWGTPFVDDLSDEDALALNITADTSLTSVQSLDKILNILGPFEGRWFYFTETTLYPSEINNPDLVDTTLGVKMTGVGSEIFLWSKIISDNGILVGTSRATYLLTGTFATLADGTIDLFYRPVETKYPSITFDADVYNGVVYYLAKDGWRGVDASGNSISLTAPNTDRIYRGDICYGYGIEALSNIIPGTTRFPIVVAKNKLFCAVTGQGRIEVYDFTRKYWHPINYLGATVEGLFYAQDGNLIALLGVIGGQTNRFLNVIDDRQNLFNQSLVLTPVFDNGTARQRKDAYTLGCKISGTNVAIAFVTDVGTLLSPSFTQVNFSEFVMDLQQFFPTGNHPKWFQLSIANATKIADLELFFEERPIGLTFKRGYNNNFKSSSPKRIRTWPFVIDTLGQDVTFTLYGDNIELDSTAFNTKEKTTVQYSTTADLFATDYSYTLNWSGIVPFELWEELDPYIVQSLPQGSLFMQYGPQDLFRYGTIKEFSFRVLPTGNRIDYRIYFADSSSFNGSITTIPNKENSYSFTGPKNTSGEIIRVEFSSANIFYPYSLRIKVFTRGTDTDGQWLPL